MKVKLSSVVVLMVCLGSLAQTDPETKQKIRAEIATVEALLPKLADGGPGLYTLAADYSRLGDSGRALDLLKRCLLLDEGFNPNDDPAFQQLRQKSEFQSLSRRLSLRYPVVQKSHVVLKIPEKT